MTAPERPLVAAPKPDRTRDRYLMVLTFLTVVGLGACVGAGPGSFMDWTFGVLAFGWIGYGLSHLTP